MRAALWLIALFAVAVALALFAGNNQAVITLFWPPHRVDLSLNLALLLAVLAFALGHLALRTLSAAFSLPAQARRWRAQQRERAMYAALMDALTHLLAGRFLRASSAARSALEQERHLADQAAALGLDGSYSAQRGLQLRALAHLVLAESAQALQNRPLRDEHLRLALEQPPAHRLAAETREGLELRAARWALEDRDPALALEYLARLPAGVARRTLALRIRLKAARLARQIPLALETARLLAKHRAFSEQGARSIVRGLAMEWLQSPTDLQRLERAWLGLEESERRMPEVALQAASRWLDLGGEPARARHWLAAVWSDWLAGRLADLPETQVLRLVTVLERCLEEGDGADLAQLESALQDQPRNPSLYYLVGMACLQRRLWGKAQQLLGQAVAQLEDLTLRRRAWRALAQLAEQRGDAAAAGQAYRKMAEL